MNIQEAIDSCAMNLLHTVSSNTYSTYRQGLRTFSAYILSMGMGMDDDLSAISIDHFIQFVSWIMTHDSYKRSTMASYISASKAFLDWMVISNYLRPDYQDALRYKTALRQLYKRHEDALVRFPREGLVETLLQTVSTMTDSSPLKERNIAIFEFLASSGCRNSEITTLKVKNIDLNQRFAKVIGKGSKERRVFFSEKAKKAILAYFALLEPKGPDEPVFCRHDKGSSGKIQPITTTSVRNIVKRVLEASGLEDRFSPHYFRHAFAIKGLQKTGNLALVQDWLGHSDPKSTRVYAKITDQTAQKAHQEVFS